MAEQVLAVPHVEIYKNGVSSASWPSAYLPNIPPIKNLKTCACHVEESNHKKKLVGGRNRIQVGATNRWRLSVQTGSDLLATTQVIKAFDSSKNKNFAIDDNPQSIQKSYMHCLNPSSCYLVKDERSYSNLKENRFLESSHVNFLNAQNQSSYLENTRRLSLRSALRKIKTVKLSIVEQIRQMHQCGCYVPMEKRSPTAMELLFEICKNSIPDVILFAFDVQWDLTYEAIKESLLLFELVQEVERRHSVEEPPEKRYSLTKQFGLKRFSVSLSSPTRIEGVPCLSLDITNPLISSQVLATALLSLYQDEVGIKSCDVVNIMVVAQLLKIPKLIKICSKVMLESIKVNNVCIFHSVAVQYELSEVETACESWLELNLLTMLSVDIYLSHLSAELLIKTLRSNKLFTFTEYSIYKMLCFWVFFQEQCSLTMPSWSTVVTWFMSIPKSVPFLMSKEGTPYIELFKYLRLNGVTDPSCVNEIHKMDIIPPRWLLSVLQNHYFALQGGGDMNLLTKFDTGSVRYGFVLDKNTESHSEIISLHGFYFELTAVKDTNGSCKCYFQRLRPNHSMLSFRICERQTFSMRQDREVRYLISIQWNEECVYKRELVGPRSQCFGFGTSTSKSEKLAVETSDTELYILFFLLFPPS